MAQELGRLGRTYGGLHTAYADTPTPASADALRHIQLLMSSDPTNKRNSPEKTFSPQQFVRFTGREVASLRGITGLFRPSGTLNTLPDESFLYEAAFGSKTNVTLSTTVSAGTGTTTGATLASATGLAKHDAVLITCADGVKRGVRLTAVDTGTGVVAWSPALDAAAPDGAVVKSGVTYKITTANALSFWLAHYLKKTDASTAGMKRLGKGFHADRFSLALDGTEEAQFTISGAGQTVIEGSSVPAQPAAFTTVGGNPPPGWQTELRIGSTLQKFVKASIEISNGLRLRNNEAGGGSSNMATESYRAGKQDIQLGLDCRLEDPAVIYAPAKAGTNVGVTLQLGFTEGGIWFIQMPQVEFKVPEIGDEDEEVTAPYKGMAVASADEQNDAIFIAQL